MKKKNELLRKIHEIEDNLLYLADQLSVIANTIKEDSEDSYDDSILEQFDVFGKPI